jgi:hypothetical protein
LKTYLELLESDLKSAIKREREKFDQENKAAFGIITSQVHLAEYHSLIGYFEEKLAMALPQGNCI